MHLFKFFIYSSLLFTGAVHANTGDVETTLAQGAYADCMNAGLDQNFKWVKVEEECNYEVLSGLDTPTSESIISAIRELAIEEGVITQAVLNDYGIWPGQPIDRPKAPIVYSSVIETKPVIIDPPRDIIMVSDATSTQIPSSPPVRGVIHIRAPIAL